MSRDSMERKLRSLVEDAGFVLAVSLDQAAMFRITTQELSPLASASVAASGFRVFFPESRLQVSTPSALVDELERLRAVLS